VGLVLVAVAATTWFLVSRGARQPPVASPVYEEATRHFYRGLAQLQVGLIDTSKAEFTRVTELVPDEPASWANLALAELRLGDFDRAAPHVERAAALLPSNADIVFLRGRLEIARGRPDEGIVHLRRAVDLDPGNLRARTALIQAIEDSGRPGAENDAERLLSELLALQPDNPAVLVERARLAAKRADGQTLGLILTRLKATSADWPPDVVAQYQDVQEASSAGTFPEAARALASLRNLLAQVPAFLEARRLVTPSAELVAEPLTAFLWLPVPVSAPSPSDAGLAFSRAVIGGETPAAFIAVQAFSVDGDQAPVIVAADPGEIRRLNGASPALRLGTDTATAGDSPMTLLPLDWNHDFRMDLVAAGGHGIRLFIQGPSGEFTDETARASSRTGSPVPGVAAAWAADIEMDGDIDIVAGVRNAPPIVLRNNGDGTWLATQPFAGITGAQAFAWGDLDNDGDPDAALVDGTGELRVFANLQSGRFQALPPPREQGGVRALTLGDTDADGLFDLVTVDRSGAIRRASLARDGWRQETIATWRPAAPGAALSSSQLILADLDNNGALDLLASDRAGTGIWLAGGDHRLAALAPAVEDEVSTVIDLDGDGRLDLVGRSAGRAVRLTNAGTLPYHFQAVRPRAQRAPGDQRVNSFGIGGEVSVRSGPLVQRQTITGPVVHIGLGARTAADVVRIVWPNGVPQAEFDTAVDAPVVAEQRLKGSCPWIFADDGTGPQFVTDFLWRSPLGLRINAQDTAGVSPSEDWVKIRGDQLKPRDGVYDVRISAELWETHFIDHVSLLVVDHPEDVDIFVDERFARQAPALAVYAMRPPQAVAQAWDQDGRDVTATVATRDERYLATFERGPYQGVAADHFVDVDLGAEIPPAAGTWLVAQGWIYPTDSSINLAIGQGGRIQPRGLSLEAQDGYGRWVMVSPDLGFPAGKTKTILVDLSAVVRAGLRGVRRVRLRTNLEIYWDFIGSSSGVPATTMETRRLNTATAVLRYRGFSQTRQEGRDRPEIPVYAHIANTAPRWRDLVGYHTRFGDVAELVERADDRYVIMNAGDELKLSFRAPAPPKDGWVRDFVLIGDGWEKDGDFNTDFSKTVLPLPSHDQPRYTAASPEPSLATDPVYLRHRRDWTMFHTRFVSPDAFLTGVGRPASSGRR